jgi:hypothetical protein
MYLVAMLFGDLHELRCGPDVIFRSGTLSSLCVSVFVLYERKNRNTDKMGSTLLPGILSLSKGRLKGV